MKGRSIVGAAERAAAEARPGEVVLEQEPPSDEVWDASNKRLRPRTDAERLDTAKAAKRAEMAAAFAAECAADFPSAWVAVAVLAGNPLDARIGALKTRMGKLRDKLAAADAATTPEEVGAIAWT